MNVINMRKAKTAGKSYTSARLNYSTCNICDVAIKTIYFRLRIAIGFFADPIE